eukprot:gene30025-39215_t
MSFSSYINEQGSRVLYHLTSLMSHSCVPNCVVDTSSVEMTVRCITAVKKGEELTIEYNEDYFDQPTHVRRAHLISSKEFLCRCPRCVSPGDDTRQFNCFDSTSYESYMFQKESTYLSEVQLLRESMQVALTQPARSQQQSDTFHRYHYFEYFSTCHSMCVEFAMEQAEFYRTTGGDAVRSNRLNAMALSCLDSCYYPSLTGLQRAREYYLRALRICDIEQRRECLSLKDSLSKKIAALLRTIDAKSKHENEEE